MQSNQQRVRKIGDRYIDVERRLSEDLIIVAMAQGIREAIEHGSVSFDQFVHSDGQTPRWGFLRMCADEYNKRGGTIESHIGGPARAVLAIVRGKEI